MVNNYKNNKSENNVRNKKSVLLQKAIYKQQTIVQKNCYSSHTFKTIHSEIKKFFLGSVGEVNKSLTSKSRVDSGGGFFTTFKKP